MRQGGEPIIVDTNILFSALLRADTVFARVLFEATWNFYVCESTLTELFRRQEKLIRRTRLDDDGLARAYYLLLKQVEVFKENRIPTACWTRARDLCAGLDLDDAPQVALTLALDGLLWTGDKALKAGLVAKGFDRFFSP